MALTYVYYSAVVIESTHMRVMIVFTWFTKELLILTTTPYTYTHSVRDKAKMTGYDYISSHSSLKILLVCN